MKSVIMFKKYLQIPWFFFRTLIYRLRATTNFRNEFVSFSQNSNKKRFELRWEERIPMLYDNTGSTFFDRHYIYHTAWAARKIRTLGIRNHTDISSSLYFNTIISAFIDVEFYDYRPANLVLDQLKTGSQDLTKLSFESNSIMSLSCMHTIEHIGLGRYGDPIDYDGDIKAIHELCRVLAAKGNLFIVVPVGSESRIQFNAHRIYQPQSLIDEFEIKGMELKEFTLIPESPQDGHLVVNPEESLIQKQKYGCGCFWFTKN